MRSVIDLERNSANLLEELRDLLHASTINMQTIKVEIESIPQQPMLSQVNYLTTLTLQLQQLLQKRPSLHMDYLITKQIQEEEENVRRERLSDYQEKIYDQRRIISDKEAFFQNLLRPKKKRTSQQTMEEFQEIRAREKQAEERKKMEIMNKQLKQLKELNKALVAQSKVLKNQNMKLGCSHSNADSTAVSMPDGEIPSQKIIPIQERLLPKQSVRHSRSHSRSSSMQRSFRGEIGSPRMRQEKVSKAQVGETVEQILKLRGQNEELEGVYDQLKEALRFKQRKNRQLKQEYQLWGKQFKQEQEYLNKVRKEQSWRHQRCYQPQNPARKGSSLSKY